MASEKPSPTNSTRVNSQVTVRIGPLDTLPAEPSLPPNPAIPSLQVETTNMIVRSDNVVMLRFFSKLPGMNLEQARVVMTHEAARALAALIARNLPDSTQGSAVQP
jgi:hypothetical protein